MTKKITFLITAALMLLTMMATTGTMWGQAAVNTTLWEETWGTFTSQVTPSNYNQSGTTVYNNATVTYTQSSTSTKLYNETLAGGTTPELLLYKNNTTWTISGIPTGGATGLTLTFKANYDRTVVSSESTGITIGTKSFSDKTVTYPITVDANVSTFALTFTNTNSANVRIDNISLVVTTAGGGSGDLEDSDLAITNQSSDLVFDLYDNATAQTINYTTSSTGAITITPTTSEYFSYVHNADNRTITVTPTAVTPSAQTVTINQAADDTYKAGSVSFTVSITNSAPQYTVTYKANGGTGDDIPVQYYAGDDVTVAENTFTYAGHAFIKWNTNEGGTGIDYLPNATIENIQADIDLYAQWEESNETIDVLNLAFTGVSGGSGYSAWSNKQGTSGAIYSGKSAGGSSTSNPSIQLRTTGNDCGIVTTTSAGNVTKVELTWNSSTSGRTLDIYGKNTAYSSAADLYSDDSNTQGTKLGSITEGNNQPTYINISGNYSYIGLRSNNNAIYINEIKITWVPDTDPAVATTVTIDATNLTNTDVYTSTAAGSLSATVKAGETPIDGASVTWESSNTDAATIDENGAVTLVEAGQTTITASYAGVANTYKPSSATYNLTVINSNVPGSQNHPYTVAQARAAIDAGTGITDVYVTGIISQVDSYNSSYHSITYWISGDGTTTSDQLEVYSGKGLNNTNFSSIDDVAVGATVVVYGTLKKYGDVYEFDYNNYLTSYTVPQVTVEAPTFSPAAGTYDEAQSVTLSCTTGGSTIYYTTDGTNPTNESTEYTAAINVENTTTIKAIAYVGNDYSTVATATYTIVALNNISDISEVGTAYSVKGTVVATNNKGLIIGDGTGYVYYYKNGSVDQSIGDMIKISGNTVTYGQIIQFTSATPNTATITEATTSSYNNTPAATVITAVPDYSTGYHLSTYLEFTGALEKSNSNYFITIGESQIQISYPTSAQSTALTALNGKTVHVKGYFSGINSSSKFTVMLESAEEVAVPAITLAQYEYNLNADGGNAELPVTYTNMPATPQAEVIFYEANGTTTATYDWITAEINSNNNIAGHIDVNEGEARSAYFKVKGIDTNDNAVYSDLVTINQAAPAAPSIVFETASMNLIAGGELDRKLSFDYSGLGNAPTFTIYYYEQDGETQVTAETYEWLTATIDENNKLNITVVANEGEARSAYLKVYGEKNENVHAESNLVTITQAEYVVDYATLPFEFDGGRADIANTNGLTQDGLDSDYGSSPKLKFNGTGDWVILKINETPGVLSFDIKGNSFSGSTFTVQTSEDGITYTDLETYTELGDTQNESFENLDENVRYIKWIYTEKVNGNVGLGNIALAEYVEPVASITVTPATVNVTAEGADEGSLAIAYENLPITQNDDFDIQFYDANNQPLDKNDEPNWMIASVQATATQDVYEVSYAVDSNDGDARTAYFKVYAMDDNSELVYSNLVTVSQEAHVAPTATIAVTPETVNVEASGEDEGSLVIAYENLTITDPADFDIQYYDANNEPLNKDNYPDWMEASIIANSTQDGYVVSFSVDPNDGDARTAYFKVYAMDDNSELVYSNLVTINQAEFVVDYAVLPFEFDGGRADIANTNGLTQEGLDSDYGSSPKLKFNTTGDWVILKINETPGVLSFDIKGNSFSGSTFKVQTSEDGETYSDLKTYTELGDTQNESFDNLGENVRYIKWIYTEKSSGNVALGNITLAEYVAPVPAITVKATSIEATAEETEGSLNVEYTLIDTDHLQILWFESNGTDATGEPDWITTDFNDNFNVDYLIDANDGEARTAYFKVYGIDTDGNDVYSDLVTVTQDAYIPTPPTTVTYSLVTSVDQIVSGKHYVIATGLVSDKYYAIGEQNGTYRNPVEVTIDNNSITYTEGLFEFVMNGDGESGWTIYDKITPGFLVKGNKSLTTDANSGTKFSISIDNENSKATIANSGYSIQYNSSNPRFACYSSNQQAVYLYVKDNDTDLEFYGNNTYTDLTIPATETLTVTEGSVLTVTGTLTNNGNASNLIIQEGGQLIHTNDVAATVQKNIAAASSWKDDVDGWYFIASPVHNFSTETLISNGIGHYDLFAYDEPTAYWRSNTGTGPGSAPFTELERGKGYLYANKDDVTLNFAGMMVSTNDNISLDLSYACTYADVKGYNLMGNPFSCNLTAGDMVIKREGDDDISVASCLVINGGSDYETCNLEDGDVIKPGQGFFIQATKADQAFIFNRTSSSKDDLVEKGFIRIAAGNDNYMDKAYVHIKNGNTLRKMNIANSTIVYVMNDGDDYAAARVEELAGTMPVHFKAVEDGEFTITINAKNIEASTMMLFDNQTGELIDLLETPTYAFKASAEDEDNRFKLIFDFNNNYNGVDDNYVNGNFAYQNGDELFVSGDGTLQVFDVMGRFVMSKEIHGSESVSVSAFETGVYMLRFVGENIMTQKIVVR